MNKYDKYNIITKSLYNSVIFYNPKLDAVVEVIYSGISTRVRYEKYSYLLVELNGIDFLEDLEFIAYLYDNEYQYMNEGA